MKTFLLASLLIVSFFAASADSFGNTTCQNKLSFSESSVTTTYERIKIDGVYWIIVYEDGIKILEIMDPDQN